VRGGAVTLGFDLAAWEPTSEQTADYAASQSAGFGYGPEGAGLYEDCSTRPVLAL
jgi:hypothetical protein